MSTLQVVSEFRLGLIYLFPGLLLLDMCIPSQHFSSNRITNKLRRSRRAEVRLDLENCEDDDVVAVVGFVELILIKTYQINCIVLKSI